jgi:hypothetical protein
MKVYDYAENVDHDDVKYLMEEFINHLTLGENIMAELVLQNVRFSYLNWHAPKATPSGDMKYSVSILISKNDEKQVEKINEAIKAAIQKGLETNKFSKGHIKSLRLPLRDGTAEYEDGARGVEYEGCFFLNANSKKQPGVVMLSEDGRRIPVIDEEEFYSGCHGHAHITFFPYNTAGNRGVGVGLNNLMKTKDGDRLDGRKSADAAFAEFGSSGDDDSEDVF